jgi:signal transduction histidine kinase
LELVEQIEKSVTSLDGVVSNVLHFARTTQLHLHPINLHALLHEVHDHFVSLYTPGAQFSLRVSGSPFLVGDQQALRQCLYNLVTNALQVTNYRGRIELETFGEQPDGGDVRVVVRDSGPGVPAELGAAVFEPFVSTRQGGTGLGLSIVKRLVDAHGGQIEVRNAPGAEFTITLPRNGVRHQRKGAKDAGA